MLTLLPQKAWTEGPPPHLSVAMKVCLNYDVLFVCVVVISVRFDVRVGSGKKKKKKAKKAKGESPLLVSKKGEKKRKGGKKQKTSHDGDVPASSSSLSRSAPDSPGIFFSKKLCIETGF